MLRFIHGLLIYFSRSFLSIFFPSTPRLYPQHHSSPYYTQPLYLRFVLSFEFLFFSTPLCSAPTPTFTYVCLCAKRLPRKPAMSCFKIHVASQPLGTVRYRRLLLVTSFSRNYYGGPPDPCDQYQKHTRAPICTALSAAVMVETLRILFIERTRPISTT